MLVSETYDYIRGGECQCGQQFKLQVEKFSELEASRENDGGLEQNEAVLEDTASE